MNETFTKAYESLNPGQKSAVESIEGPVMVVAGPGTGKTQVLTIRIANILKNTDTAPSSILALTLTDSASMNMRKRLFSIIGAPESEFEESPNGYMMDKGHNSFHHIN